MRIDFLGLEAFLAIANWRSFRRAAGHLNLSQAALSHRLKKLEDDLGLSLLSRTTRQVTLTADGLELLPVAQRSIDEISSILEGLRERGHKRHERVTIGCLPTASLLFLPSILAEFRKHRPDTTIQIFDNSAPEIANRVRSGEADLGFTIVSVDSWDLEITPLLKDPFVLVCPDAHPLACRASIQWREIQGEPLIRISTEAGNRALIDDALGERRDLMSWRYEVQHIATALGLVRAGGGLTVVPKIGFDATDSAGTVAVPLCNPAVSRTLGVVARRGTPFSPGAALLMSLIGDSVKRRAVGGRDDPSPPGEGQRPTIGGGSTGP